MTAFLVVQAAARVCKGFRWHERQPEKRSDVVHYVGCVPQVRTRLGWGKQRAQPSCTPYNCANQRQPENG